MLLLLLYLAINNILMTAAGIFGTNVGSALTTSNDTVPTALTTRTCAPLSCYNGGSWDLPSCSCICNIGFNGSRCDVPDATGCGALSPLTVTDAGASFQLQNQYTNTLKHCTYDLILPCHGATNSSEATFTTINMNIAGNIGNTSYLLVQYKYNDVANNSSIVTVSNITAADPPPYAGLNVLVPVTVPFNKVTLQWFTNSDEDHLNICFNAEDPCTSAQCGVNGTCNRQCIPNGYTCDCDIGYEQANISVPCTPKACVPLACGNCGTWDWTTCSCVCEVGFSGSICDVPGICYNGGQYNQSDCLCHCQDGYYNDNSTIPPKAQCQICDNTWRCGAGANEPISVGKNLLKNLTLQTYFNNTNMYCPKTLNAPPGSTLVFNITGPMASTSYVEIYNVTYPAYASDLPIYNITNNSSNPITVNVTPIEIAQGDSVAYGAQLEWHTTSYPDSVTIDYIAICNNSYGINCNSPPTNATPTIQYTVSKTSTVAYIVCGCILGVVGFIAAVFYGFYLRRRLREKRIRDFLGINIDENYEIPRGRLAIFYDEKLGAGAFGAVYKGKILEDPYAKKKGTVSAENNWNTKTGVIVAVKCPPVYSDVLAKSSFIQEVEVMKGIGYHQNVVNLIGCIIVDEPISLVVEYCSDGDLLTFLRNNSQLTNDDEDANEIGYKDMLSYAIQISAGMDFIASKGYVHRDLAARNVLVHEKMYCKVGDFGLTRFTDEDLNYTSKGGKLPFKWMAPECMVYQQFNIATDIWSFGVVLYEIVTMGKVPYANVDLDDLLTYLESGQRLEKPEDCPDQFYEIMLMCWEAEAAQRGPFSKLNEALKELLECEVPDSYIKFGGDEAEVDDGFAEQEEIGETP